MKKLRLLIALALWITPASVFAQEGFPLFTSAAILTGMAKQRVGNLTLLVLC
ncbi:MAG: hypothetical protein V7641_5473 [Blastocatellia bacterium]